MKSLKRFSYYGREDALRDITEQIFEHSWLYCGFPLSVVLQRGHYKYAIPKQTKLLRFLRMCKKGDKWVDEFFEHDFLEGEHPGEDSCLHGYFELLQSDVESIRIDGKPLVLKWERTVPVAGPLLLTLHRSNLS